MTDDSNMSPIIVNKKKVKGDHAIIQNVKKKKAINKYLLVVILSVTIFSLFNVYKEIQFTKQVELRTIENNNSYHAIQNEHNNILIRQNNVSNISKQPIISPPENPRDNVTTLSSNITHHPDEGNTIVASQNIYYRMNINHFINANQIIVGILSGAGGTGPSRRQVIRETWASNHTGIYFLVAGPWNDIEQEYNTHGDLLWIHKDEMYNKEDSVLTYKTLSFLSIIEDLSTRYNKEFSFAFKTDDDSYVNMKMLEEELFNKSDHEPYDYIGRCHDSTAPRRDKDNKWYVSYETYPETKYPPYCEGLGYVVSKRFLNLAAEGKHIENTSFMPFEDIAVGLISAQIEIKPVINDYFHKLFVNFRTGLKYEKRCIRKGLKFWIERSLLPEADMKEKILQHRIYDDEDMRDHHRSLVSPNSSIQKEKSNQDDDIEQTGYRANCTLIQSSNDDVKLSSNITHHPDEGNTIVACHQIYYRMNINNFINANQIIVGILSGAGGTGPSRRQVIRETWASNHTGVYFLVAGPWNDIEEEYNTHGDLLWIHQEEMYNQEYSVLTYKTLSFLNIIEDLSTRYNKEFSFAFKTDDDSYVNMKLLKEELFNKSDHEPYDYIGRCHAPITPSRDSSLKWYVRYETYPEKKYPPYCEGLGFVVSKRFLNLAAEGKHIKNTRYMPFEDVAVGLVSARIGIKPVINKYLFKRFVNFRFHSRREGYYVLHGLSAASSSKMKLPKADMKGKILQHRIYDDKDMRNHHKSYLSLVKS